MNRPINPTAGFSASVPRLVVSGLAIMLPLLLIIGWVLYDLRRETTRRAEEAVSNIAASLGQSIDRFVSSLDLSLQAAVRGMDLPGIRTLDPAVRQAMLFDGSLAAQGLTGLGITDATGALLYDSNRNIEPGKFVGDREYFAAARDNPGSGLIVSRPVRNRIDGRMALVLARRLHDVDGKFAGIVFATLPIDFFSTLFKHIDTGRDGLIFLFSTEKYVIMREPLDESEIGQENPNARVYKLFESSPNGLLHTRGMYHGVPRLASYRQIGDYPLIIGAAISLSEIYSPWIWRSVSVGIVIAALGSIGIGILIALRNELRRRALAEEETRQSQQRYAAALSRLDALFQNASDSMIVVAVSDDGTMTYESVNPVWCKANGIRAGEAVGHSPNAFFPAATQQIIMGAWSECLATRKPVHYAFSAHRNNRLEDLESTVVPVFDADGRINRLTIVARNVTDRNRREAETHRSQRMEAVGQLTAGVAHDFNNLLQSIRTGLNVLSQIEPGGDASACLAIVRGAVDRGATLTHQLLAFSRDQPLEPVSLNPAAVIADMVALLRRTLEGRVLIEQDAGSSAWMIRADRSQLDNCLLNLALNARDAMPSGGSLMLCVDDIRADAAVRLGMPRGEYVRLSLADTGAGMTAEILARAREPFFTTKSAGQGSGLGLSMVHGFALQSGGALQLESAPGTGTVASIWLPRHIAQAEAPPAKPELSPDVTRIRARILLVDDDAGVRDAMGILLRMAGFVVTTAEDGQVAARLLSSNEPVDLLVTDQYMPGLQGHELVEKALLLRPALPAILMTGYDRVRALERLPASVKVFRKPFDGEDFLNHVRWVLTQGMPANSNTIAA